MNFDEALVQQRETGKPMKSKLATKSNQFPPPPYSLTLDGYFVDKVVTNGGLISKLRKELLIQPPIIPAFSNCQPKRYRIYTETEYGYYLPRYYAFNVFGKPKFSNLSSGTDIDVQLNSGVKPLPFQKKSLEILKDTFQNRHTSNGGILSLPCGWGKTFCAIWTIANLGKKTLILVGKEFLAEQWEQAIKTFISSGNTGTPLTVGRVQGKRFDSDCQILVGMIQTVSQRKFKRSDFKDIGFLIVDECHHMSSEVFCQALRVIQPRFTLGLSATPKRKDGLSHVFHYFLGPLLHREERTTENRVKIIQPEIYSCSKYYETKYNGRGNVNTVEIASHLTNCPSRNKLIIRLLADLFKEKRKVLLLSNRREHLHTLYDMLTSEPLEYRVEQRPVTFGIYYGGQGKKHRQMLEESTKADLILGTDSIAKEGLDIPALNTLFLATPAGLDVEQSVGRILRRVHQIEPLVIDLIDRCGNFQKHGTTRAKWYRKQDYIVVKSKLDLENYTDQELENISKSKSKSKLESKSESDDVMNINGKLRPLFDST